VAPHHQHGRPFREIEQKTDRELSVIWLRTQPNPKP
jgi:hypothetical protein